MILSKYMRTYDLRRELTEAAVLMNLNTRFDQELIYVSQHTLSNGVTNTALWNSGF